MELPSLSTHPLPYVLLASLPFIWLWKKRNTLPLPPGPRRWPIVGNLFNFPSGKHWLVYDQWCKQYGDIMSYEILGQRFVVLGSMKRTNELLGKRSAIYSGRKVPPFLRDVVVFPFVFFNLDYGPSLRRHRRAFHEHFQPSVLSRYHPKLLRATHVLIRNLYKSPENFFRNLRFFFAFSILDVTFDLQIEGLNNEYILNSEQTAQAFSRGLLFGSTWIDYAPFMIPIMKYVPNWFPGAGYKKQAEIWNAAGHFVEWSAYETVKKDLANGIDHSCVVARLLESIPEGTNPQERAEAEAVVRSVGAIAYFAAGDSTLTASLNFIAAMVKYPGVQKKAQAEIDRAVGRNRLPDYSDRDSLPYITAIVKETQRWNLVNPNIGHLCTEDDEIDGYFIPKGTVVIGNSWSLLHDPEVYPEPEKYQPERFLANPPPPDPDAAFGYGRRICPGRFFSHEQFFIVIASILAVFDISPPVDESGNPVEIMIDYNNGFLAFPSLFKCIIRPRSSQAEALILATEEMNHVV